MSREPSTHKCKAVLSPHSKTELFSCNLLLATCNHVQPEASPETRWDTVRRAEACVRALP